MENIYGHNIYRWQLQVVTQSILTMNHPLWKYLASVALFPFFANGQDSTSPISSPISAPVECEYLFLSTL